jgi:hypothetical protein
MPSANLPARPRLSRRSALGLLSAAPLAVGGTAALTESAQVSPLTPTGYDGSVRIWEQGSTKHHRHVQNGGLARVNRNEGEDTEWSGCREPRVVERRIGLTWGKPCPAWLPAQIYQFGLPGPMRSGRTRRYVRAGGPRSSRSGPGRRRGGLRGPRSPAARYPGGLAPRRTAG